MDIDKSTVNKWKKDEAKIRAAPGKADRVRQDVRSRTGAYPLMEEKLKEWIVSLRDAGMAVSTSLVTLKARMLLKDMHPQAHFEFTNSWRTAFFKRHHLAVRAVTNTNKQMLSMEQVLQKCANFHRDVRISQEDKRAAGDDAEYGWHTCYVFNRDEVPICLAPPKARTVNTKGAETVQCYVGESSDTKPFCTLILSIPRHPLPSGKMPHGFVQVIFASAKEGEGADRGKKEELQQRHPRVHVLYQKKAWLDTKTNILSLRAIQKGVEEIDAELFPDGGDSLPDVLLTEDNLGSHTTAEIQALLDGDLSRFTQFLFPANLTDCMQPVDRHVGKIFKYDVYEVVRTAWLERVQQWTDAGRDADDLPRMEAWEKRSIVVDSVAKTWERLAANGNFEKAFIGCGCVTLPSRQTTCVDVA